MNWAGPEIVTQALGGVAVLLIFLSYQFNGRKGILALISAGMIFLAIHQLLLGAYAGVAANSLTLVRNLVFYFKNDDVRLQHPLWPYGFTAAIVPSVLVFWQGWHSILPALAVVSLTFAFWANDTRTIRLLSIVGSLFWLPYAIVINSIPTMAIQVVIISSIVLAMMRFDRKPF
jgi:hypothetical protein